jgi:hypothetical protein
MIFHNIVHKTLLKYQSNRWSENMWQYELNIKDPNMPFYIIWNVKLLEFHKIFLK